MCGIYGIASKTGDIDPNNVVKCLNTLYHRGPDNYGTWVSDDNKIAFGHRRLSIIDLSPLGHQPMWYLRDKYCIVFNGEIYNYIELRDRLIHMGYSFNTCSDTEVILATYHEYREKFLDHLNGMFALAIYDKDKRTVFVARDRAGEKPLFYFLQNNTLHFASELKALLADRNLPRNIDKTSLDCFLFMGYVPSERCILTGYRKLPPGCAMKFNVDSGEHKVWRYWKIPDFDMNFQAVGENELLIELESLLNDSVKKQLVADVPVGILLSGGVDSSLITALAVRHKPKVNTFTVSMRGYKKYDESSHARLIADYFNTSHTELIAGDISVDLIRRLAVQYDEPIIDSSMIPTFLVTEAIKKSCTVALGGDGGDELFGGYLHHSRLQYLKSHTSWIPGILKRSLGCIATKLPMGFKGRNWLQVLASDLETELPNVNPYFDKNSRKALMGKDWSLSAEEIRYRLTYNDSSDILERSTRTDFNNYLPEDILVKVDRASMMNSLELRAPILDYRIIEFAYSKVPSRYKANESEKKILLKKLTEKLLPPVFDRQRKQGFSIPLDQYIKYNKDWQDLFNDVLLNNKNSIFNPKLTNILYKGLWKGRSTAEVLYALLIFEMWKKEYNISL